MRGARHASQYRPQLIERYGDYCFYCGMGFRDDMAGFRPTLDHIIPWTLGGRHQIANFVPACANCNRDRQTQDFVSYCESNRLKRKLPMLQGQAKKHDWAFREIPWSQITGTVEVCLERAEAVPLKITSKRAGMV